MILNQEEVNPVSNLIEKIEKQENQIKQLESDY
jgi:hypothetical protein